MSEHVLKIALPEDERMRYCPLTISNKHLWNRAIIGEQFQYINYNQDGTPTPYVTPISGRKCFACGVVDDYSEAK